MRARRYRYYYYHDDDADDGDGDGSERAARRSEDFMAEIMDLLHEDD